MRYNVDVYHTANTARKDVMARSKTKEGKGLEEWLRSILNQLWSSSRTSGGDPDLRVEEWKSILYHACNIHEWPDDPEYKLVHKCDHTPKGIGIACPTVQAPKPAPSFYMVKNDSHNIFYL